MFEFLTQFFKSPEPEGPSWEVRESSREQRAYERALLEGRARCCHGNGEAAFEKIVSCECGTTWHTGCVTQFLMKRSLPKEHVLMDNDGVLHRTPVKDPYECCREALKDKGTTRKVKSSASNIETASSRSHRQRISKLKDQGFNL